MKTVHIKQLSPVQAVDHVSHSVDEILVFLGAADDDAVELLHVGVNGVKRGRLPATCGTTSVRRRHLNISQVLFVSKARCVSF